MDENCDFVKRMHLVLSGTLTKKQRKIFYENQRYFQKPLTSNNERRSQNAIPRDKIFYENGPYLRLYTENQ